MQHFRGRRVFIRMSAFACEIGETDSAVIERGTTNLFARGIPAQSSRRCPNCDSIIYSRRHKNCGVCAEPLPAACIFSDAEAQNVRVLLQEERSRHRKWLYRVNFEE